jgi:UDPglucose 6-dehydrogenase
LNAVLEINVDARRRFVDKIQKMLGGNVRGKRIGVLGLSFKPDTDDMRESPSIDVINMLRERGAEVQAFDPIAMEVAREWVEGVNYCSDAYEVASGADALVLITAWNEFKQLDMEKVRDLMRNPVIVDGRNVYDPHELRSMGFRYSGVGRA